MPSTDNTWPTTVSTVASGVRRRPWLIPLVALVVGALAYGISTQIPDKYEATSRLLFQPVDPAPRVDPATPGPDASSTPERTAATNLALASAAADATTVTVRDKLRLGLGLQDLRDRVGLTPEGQADIVTITATGGSAAEATRIANTYAAEIVALRQRRAQDRVQRVIDAINARLAAGPPADVASTLQARSEQLQVEKALQTGDVEVAELAVPPAAPSAPRPLLNGMIGAALGVLLALGLAVVLRRQDRPVEDEEDLETIIGADVLARVPNRGDSAVGRQGFREALHFLRTNLQLREDARRARVIGLVSPTPGHGKSVVAVGLTDALATSGSDVIAIDCDLRRPALHRYLHGELSPGVVDVIDGRDETSSLVQETSHAGVRLVAAGAALSESTSSSVGLGRITRLLKHMRQSADYVIVDTSAVTIGADSTVVAKALDGVIMVVDLKVVDRDVLAAATEQLRGAGVRIFGIVLNRAEGFQPRWRSGGTLSSLRGRRDAPPRDVPARAAPVRDAPAVSAAPVRGEAAEDDDAPAERETRAERDARAKANGAANASRKQQQQQAGGAPRSGRAARSSGRTPPRRSDRRST
jgi:capsular exopolysaccharide synthesis family protein